MLNCCLSIVKKVSTWYIVLIEIFGQHQSVFYL